MNPDEDMTAEIAVTAADAMLIQLHLACQETRKLTEMLYPPPIYLSLSKRNDKALRNLSKAIRILSKYIADNP